MSPEPAPIIFGIPIILLMLLIGAAIVLQVLLKARARKISVRGLAPAVASNAWLLPIVLVVGYVLAQAAPYLQQQPAPPDPVERLLEPESDGIPLVADAASVGTGATRTRLVADAGKVGADAGSSRHDDAGSIRHDRTEAADRSEDKSSETPPNPDLPDWVRAAPVSSDVPSHHLASTSEGGDGSRIALSSQRFATIEQAKDQVLAEAVERVRESFHQAHAYQGQWVLPGELVDAHVVKNRYVEEIDHDFGRFTGRMYRVHLQLDLDPDQVGRADGPIYASWRDQIVHRRLWLLGSLLGLAALVLGTAAAYLRLDMMTAGRYRNRLRLAATLLIAAGGFTAASLIPRV